MINLKEPTEVSLHKEIKQGFNNEPEKQSVAQGVSRGRAAHLSPWSASLLRSGWKRKTPPDGLRWGWIKEIQSASLSPMERHQAPRVGRARLLEAWKLELKKS